jgi:hypothetical protein
MRLRKILKKSTDLESTATSIKDLVEVAADSLNRLFALLGTSSISNAPVNKEPV